MQFPSRKENMNRTQRAIKRQHRESEEFYRKEKNSAIKELHITTGGVDSPKRYTKSQEIITQRKNQRDARNVTKEFMADVLSEKKLRREPVRA